MSIEIHLESDCIDWENVFSEAYSCGIDLSMGDPVPHGLLSIALQELGGAATNSEASVIIERGVASGRLTTSSGEFCEEYHLGSPTAVEFEEGVFADDLVDTPQWLITKPSDKKPCAPWVSGQGVINAHDESHWTDFETARAYADDLGGNVGFDLTADDDLVLIDFDGARDPETGEVDPAVDAFVERAESYADVSTSGTGVHVLVRGELPEGVRSLQGDFSPEGTSIEVYHRKRFCVMTGQHIVDTPTQCEPRQALIDELADEYARTLETVPGHVHTEPRRSREELAAITVTSDPDVIWDAVRQTGPQDLWLRSRVTEERSDGTLSLDPSWEHSESGTRIGQFSDGWVYRKGMIGLDALQIVALEERIIHSPDEYPRGEKYWEAVDALRDRGASIPEYRPESEPELPVDSFTDVLELDSEALRTEMEARGATWPDTDEVRERLAVDVNSSMRRAEDIVFDAPTAAGKSHVFATTRWTDNPDLTGEAPVVMLSGTRKARDELVEKSRKAGVECAVLYGREDSCPLACGDYDEGNDCDNTPIYLAALGGQSPSEWFESVCEGQGVPFSVAHAEFEKRFRAEMKRALPCCQNDEPCQSRAQWTNVPRDEEGDVFYDVIHATHQFAHVPSLIRGSNVIFDERVDFELGLSKNRIGRMIESLLRANGAYNWSWERFVTTAWHGSTDERQALRESLEPEPSRQWFIEDPSAHAYAPAIARAIFDAESVGNMRRVGRAVHELPQWDDEDGQQGWNKVSVTIVMTEGYDVRSVLAVPSLLDARCVIGLDAYPSLARWQLNTVSNITVQCLLRTDERKRWRLFERGLLCVQVGKADRPLTSLENFNRRKTDGLISELRRVAPELKTAITSKTAKPQILSLLREHGVESPKLMHFGEEKSRNDFADEECGLIVGCIDPGDDAILDWLAMLGLDAEPVRSDADCDDCSGDGCRSCLQTGKKREHGRGFAGPDAETATELLQSVREDHVAQAMGRYARDATRPSEFTPVFAWTAAIPEEMVDLSIPDVLTLTETQRSIADLTAESDDGLTARAIADSLDIHKETVRRALVKLEKHGHVSVEEGAGKHGASIYRVVTPVEAVLDTAAQPQRGT